MEAPGVAEERRALQAVSATGALAIGKAVLGDATRPGTHLSDDDLNALGDLIRKLDTLLDLARARGEADLLPETRGALPMVRINRQLAYLLLATQSPDQAWFWTEEWQAGEREVEAAKAAGRLSGPHSEEVFDAALRAARGGGTPTSSGAASVPTPSTITLKPKRRMRAASAPPPATPPATR
jgi:hypothetical protein